MHKIKSKSRPNPILLYTGPLLIYEFALVVHVFYAIQPHYSFSLAAALSSVIAALTAGMQAIFAGTRRSAMRDTLKKRKMNWYILFNHFALAIYLFSMLVEFSILRNIPNTPVLVLILQSLPPLAAFLKYFATDFRKL
jgi:hypothetical protein